MGIICLFIRTKLRLKAFPCLRWLRILREDAVLCGPTPTLLPFPETTQQQAAEPEAAPTNPAPENMAAAEVSPAFTTAPTGDPKVEPNIIS